MKIPKGHAKRVQQISTATPRQVVANMLSALLPRQPIATRAPSPANMPSPGTGGYSPPDPLRKLQRKTPRRRTRLNHKMIRPLVRPEISGIRRGTGRYVKLLRVWDEYDRRGGGVPMPLDLVLGALVTDGKGKITEIDTGSINGMLERGHVELIG